MLSCAIFEDILTEDRVGLLDGSSFVGVELVIDNVEGDILGCIVTGMTAGTGKVRVGTELGKPNDEGTAVACILEGKSFV